MDKNKILGYKYYANKQALELAKWSLQEKDRIKASKIKKVANKMEYRYRNSKEYKQKKNSIKLARDSKKKGVRFLTKPLNKPNIKKFR